MKSSVTRTELLAFWKKMERVGIGVGTRSRRIRHAISACALASSFDLHSMKSTMSGWSTLRMTILAARRVLPPDLMTPAKASKPFMKLSGPLAVPPPLRPSVEERSERKIGAGARSPLEEHAFGLGQGEDGVERVLAPS